MSIYYLVHAKTVQQKMNHNEKKTIHWSKSNTGN